MRMRGRKLFVALALALVASAIAVPVFATHTPTGAVTATVTPVVVSITVSESLLEYGALHIDTTGNLPSPVSFIVENNGDVNEDFTITGRDSTAWAIGPNAGTNIYKQEATIDGFTTPVVLSTTPVALAGGVIPTGTETVALRLDMPVITSVTDEQDVGFTITASITP